MNRRDLFRKTLATAVTLATLPLGAKEPEFWVGRGRTELTPNNQIKLGAFPTSYIQIGKEYRE
jgi:hypothetical protein